MIADALPLVSLRTVLLVAAFSCTASFLLHAPGRPTSNNTREPRVVPASATSLATWEVDTDPKANFCWEGKLLPQFYLLGAPKCATTSFSMELGRHGHVREAPKLWSPKEWHFWEHFAEGTDHQKAQKLFFDALGDCPETRLVLGDYSITNLAAVPLPKGMQITPCSCVEQPPVHGGDAPRLVRAAYGEKASKNITLMAMLREPVARMQSSWHHAKAENFSSYWGYNDCCTTSFEAAITHIVDSVDQGYYGLGMAGTGSVWASMYGWQLEEWLKYFDASQLIIVPYRAYTSGAKAELCRELSRRMRAPMDCNTQAPRFFENVHTHKELHEELSADLQARVTAVMHADKVRLLSVLVRAHAHGARLESYTGRKWDYAALKAWLEENW